MRIGFNIGRPSREKLVVLVEALAALNRLQIRRSPRPLPALYGTKVRYQREARDPRTGLRREDFRTIAEVLKYGTGDCEDLVAYQIAMRREQGIHAIPWITRNGNTWHVRLRYPSGEIEDPSARLGMPTGRRSQ